MKVKGKKKTNGKVKFKMGTTSYKGRQAKGLKSMGWKGASILERRVRAILKSVLFEERSCSCTADGRSVSSERMLCRRGALRSRSKCQAELR